MTAKEPRGLSVADDNDTIDLMALVQALWAGKWLIAITSIIMLALGLYYALGALPIYSANAMVQLESRSGSLSLPEGMQDLLGDASQTNPADTETAILQSRMVIGRAAQELGLQISAAPLVNPVLRRLPQRLHLPDMSSFFGRSYGWGNEDIRIGALEVPEDWLDQPMRLAITGPDSYAIGLPDGTIQEGKVRVPLLIPDRGFKLTIGRMDGPVGRVFEVTKYDLQTVVGLLQTNLTVESGRNSSILNLTLRDPDPRQAERILDAITRAYVAQNVARSAAEAENSLDFIEQQLPVAQAAVAKAQQALNEYRQKQQSIDIDYETRSLLERATDIQAQLNKLDLDEEEIRKNYTVNHPTYQALLENRAALQGQLEEIRKATANLPETQKEIFNLTRDLDVAQQVYLQLLNRAQELRVVRASSVGSVRVIDTAYSNGAIISPRLTLLAVMSLALGLTIGAMIVLLRQFLRRGIRGAQEIEQIGLPVFATISFSPEAMNNRKTKGYLPILSITQPDDVVVESMRSLRTSLHFGMLDSDTKAILLTSAAPGAGKSFTAVNLAVVAAQAGQRVCLIDADLRKGYLRRYFGQEKNTPGLAEYLAKEKTLDEVMIDGPVPGLSVILTGRFPPNPSELVMRAEFDELLKQLRDRFDLILVDSPPALAVTDPVVLGRYTGTTIVVARHLETMLAEVEAVRRAFETAGCKVTGAVLNGYKAEEGSRYGGQYHYYNYRYSYRSERS